MKKFATLFLALLITIPLFASETPEFAITEDAFFRETSAYSCAIPFSSDQHVAVRQVNTAHLTATYTVSLYVMISGPDEMRHANPSEYKIHALNLGDSVFAYSKDGSLLTLSLSYTDTNYYPHTVASFFISLSDECLANGYTGHVVLFSNPN